MSLSTAVNSLASRVATEIKALRRSSLQKVYWVPGTGWGTRPTADVVMWISTNDASALPPPSDSPPYDMWVRHPDALEML